MTEHDFLGETLTKDWTERATFLTLTAIVLLFSTFSHADAPPVAAEAAAKLHISEVATYLRGQGLKSLALLPQDVRDTVGWFSRQHDVALTGDEDQPEDHITPAPVAIEPSFFFSDAPINLEATVHHKGFLPTHDAIMLGTSFHRAALHEKLQFTGRPFFGQSWHSLQHYWGAELSLDITQRPDSMPWGKITMNYTGGEQSLTDHGRGIDLHGDVDLTHGWQFTSGIRQNDLSGNANYVSLRWKLDFP